MDVKRDNGKFKIDDALEIASELKIQILLSLMFCEVVLCGCIGVRNKFFKLNP